MLTFYVYILKCSDGSYYTGHTNDMEKRLAEHQLGVFDSYTSQRLPVDLVFVKTCGTRYEAIDAEFKIKRWNRNKKTALIESNWDNLTNAAKKKF